MDLTRARFEQLVESALERCREPCELALKDAELMLQAAGDARAPLPFGGIVRDKLLTAAARGMEDLDWAVISEISRTQAGLA